MSGSGSDAAEVELIPFTSLESERDLWSELAERSGNPFATWEWASVWWKHFAPRAKPVFVMCRMPSEDPFAILPLYEAQTRPLRVLRFVGHGPGDVLGPVCDPEHLSLAGLALGRILNELPDRYSFVLAERLPGEVLGKAVGGSLVQIEANPRLEIQGATWNEYVSTRSRNLREKLRRSARKLEREHDVRFRLCEQREELTEDMNSMFRLHEQRWGTSGAFLQEKVMEFHRELAEVLLDRGWLRLWTMTIDGEPAAAWYGFRFAGTEHFYQSGRDPRFDCFSAGFVLLTRTIEAAFDDGLAAYAFLRGGEPYKSRFATTDDGLQTRVVARGPIGRAAVGTAAAVIRVPRLRNVAARVLRTVSPPAAAAPAPGA